MQLPDLPGPVVLGLDSLVKSAQQAFGASLRCVTLFGSAAEGRLRPTSDVNVLLVLSEFDRAAAQRFSPALGAARIAIRLEAMFVREAELAQAAIAFSEKFLDIAHRRHVLFGPDLLANVEVPREAAVARLQQVLLNFTLRLRETFVSRANDEQALTRAVADAAGPLRGCAATLLSLEGTPVPNAREALVRVAREELSDETIAEQISTAREQRKLPPGVAASEVFALLGLTEKLRARAARLASR